MQGPPNRRTPPILFNRPTYEWISRVNQKHKHLTELQLSAGQKNQLERWAEAEFVYSTLSLEDPKVSRKQVEQLLSTPASAKAEDIGSEAVALIESLRKVTSLAQAMGRTAQLTVDLLLDLDTAPGTHRGFRSGVGDASRFAKPVSPENLAAVLETACQWYAADSFVELHPIEQASIVFLRLMEIQPFEQGNERTALVASSLLTLRVGLPPVIVKHEKISAYQHALDEGARMDTKPMVELVAEAVENTLTEMIEEAERQREKGKREK